MMTRREIALKASQAAAAAKAARRAQRGKVTGSAWRKSKPGRASMLTITPAPKQSVESAHAHTVQFLSELRVGLMSEAELEQALRERQARLLQLERMPKLLRDAAPDYQQTRADILSFSNEIMRRKLAKLQREQAQAHTVEHEEELSNVA